MNAPITYVATGDSFITSPLNLCGNDKFEKIKDLIYKSEVRFTNLEVTVHDFEGYPSAFSGGTWAIANPNVLKDIKYLGFNLLNIANNHTLDYSHNGLEATEKYLKDFDFVYAGAGSNMAAASDPKYLNCSSGRVGFVAATSTFHESWIAGEQRRDMIGRPGVNGLRHESTHIISKDKMRSLKEIANITDINAMNNLNLKEGFDVGNTSDVFKFGIYKFKEGNNEGLITKPDSRDMERILRSVYEAKRQADEVIVSIHSHEMKGEDKSVPADFLRDFAKECIDHGASAVIGHGPHILRGIEIYKNCPIFYSLGNFIFQTDLVSNLPSDFYEKYGLTHENNTADALDARSKNGTVGLGKNPYVWESVIASWKSVNKKTEEILLYPITLGYDSPRYKRGLPELSDDRSILRRLAKLSEPFGTNIEIEGNVGKIKI
jgi:poly-gamma-glutamate synthesis protein (capsule biosynthesis protein)